MTEAESKSESTKPAETTRGPREPRALSTEYHKARKQLMLWAGILFIWELIGIDLEKAKEAGGNAGAIIGAIKSPQAVPWVLLILVLYFAFKLRVEWRQCNEGRRAVREAKQDYYSAFVVAVAACALYVGQTMSRIQLANAVQSSSKAASAMIGFGVGATLSNAVIWQRPWRASREEWLRDLLPFYLGSTLVIVVPIWVYMRRFSVLWPFLLIGLVLGVAVGALLNLWMNRREIRGRAKADTE